MFSILQKVELIQKLDIRSMSKFLAKEYDISQRTIYAFKKFFFKYYVDSDFGQKKPSFCEIRKFGHGIFLVIQTTK